MRAQCSLNLYMSDIICLTRACTDRHLGGAWSARLLLGVVADCRCEDLLNVSSVLGADWPRMPLSEAGGGCERRHQAGFGLRFRQGQWHLASNSGICKQCSSAVL